MGKRIGRKIGIFMDAVDEEAFVAEIVKVRGACFCKDRIAEGADTHLVQLPEINTKPPRDVYWLIRPQLTAHDLVLKHFDGFDMVDAEDSQIITFKRSVILDGICYGGGLWYAHKLKDGSPKPREFVKWGEALFRWLRNSYPLRLRLGHHVYHGGPHAEQESLAGRLTIAQGSPNRRVRYHVERFGEEFGFIPSPPEEGYDRWQVTVEPGNQMAFTEPWDSGVYDTQPEFSAAEAIRWVRLGNT